MIHATAGTGRPTKRAVNLSVDESVLLRARTFTDNLSATVEQLLRSFVQQEEVRRRAEDDSLDQVLAALNAAHARNGLLSDDFPSL